MVQKILDTIGRYFPNVNGRCVTVALSGGADSVALLYALNSIKGELGITLAAAHFNHQIRGEEAERDQSFVEDICKKLEIPLKIGSANVPEYAKNNGVSLELAARELRYTFFNGLDTEFIATAHTASDNLETVLFNLARGTAIKGLCGIPKIRGNIIRPLIDCTRDEVEAYCKENGIAFVTDSTNLSDDYSRNFIRHNIVPQLKHLNPSVEKAVGRMTETLSYDAEILEVLALNEYNRRIKENLLNVDLINELDTAIAFRVLFRYIENNTQSDVEQIHIELILKVCKNGGAVCLPGGFRAVVENGILGVEKETEEKTFPDFTVEIATEDFNFTENSNKIHKLFLNNTLDCDKIVGQLVKRTRREGDSIRLYKRHCTKTLKKLFSEYKIPINLRDSIPVLCDDAGVVWIYGIGVAERCAVSAETKKICKISSQISS